jgi:XTP/dITP diphosphohydrolase
MMPKKLVLATKNPGKVREMRAILADIPVGIQSLIDFPYAPEIVEDGDSLEENALKKARIIFNYLKLPVLSDDTGLEVFSLGLAPGVYSARYAGQNVSYADNNRKLLKELNGLDGDKRKAQFRCVVAFVSEGVEKVFEGVCKGSIIEQERGTGGFGYDPLFKPQGFDQTFAELPPETKNLISHRGNALKAAKEFLAQFFAS